MSFVSNIPQKKKTISNIILVQSCTIHININLNSRPGMQQVYENNHTLVPYHEQFYYACNPDISSLSTKILLTFNQNEIQQTLMSMLQLSLLSAFTLNAKNKKLLSICCSWTTGSQSLCTTTGLALWKSTPAFQVRTLKLQIFSVQLSWYALTETCEFFFSSH